MIRGYGRRKAEQTGVILDVDCPALKGRGKAFVEFAQ